MKNLTLQTIVRAASALLIAGATLISLPRPAEAQNLETPLRVYFTQLYCVDESDDWGNSDEPYVVIFAADLRGTTPRSITRMSQVFDDVDSGERRNTSVQFWDLNGNGSPIASPDDYLFLVALVESDDIFDSFAVRRRIETTLGPKLQSYKAAGLDRRAISSNLRSDMQLAIDASKGSDDQYGPVQELIFYWGDLSRAREGYTVEKTHVFRGGDFRYNLTFRLQ